MVISSGPGVPYNAIAAAIATKDGKLWMAFGSFWRGIHLIELNPETGLRKNIAEAPLRIAAHAERRPNAIEAPYLHSHDNWFYLFVNWDVCCQRARSTYNIRVGRSKTITGPYLDKKGVALTDGGGTPFLSSKHDDGTGRPHDDKIGPGHAGILRDEGGVHRFSFHYEYSHAREERSVLEIRTLIWKDGWPEI